MIEFLTVWQPPWSVCGFGFGLNFGPLSCTRGVTLPPLKCPVLIRPTETLVLNEAAGADENDAATSVAAAAKTQTDESFGMMVSGWMPSRARKAGMVGSSTRSASRPLGCRERRVPGSRGAQKQRGAEELCPCSTVGLPLKH